MSRRMMMVGPASSGGSSSGFVYKRTITIDCTKCGSTDTTNVRVPVIGVYSWLATVANGGRLQNASGYDVAFYTDSALTTRCAWEIEKYTASNGDVFYWVLVPNVTHATNLVFYIAYSHSTISTDQSDKHTVWGANAKSVLHFGNGTTLSIADSSITNETWFTNGPPTAGTGKLYGGMVTSNQEVHTDADMPSTGWTNLTGRVWFKPSTVAGAEHGIFSHGSLTSPSFLIQLNGNLLKFYADGAYRESSQTLSSGTWYLVQFTLSVVSGTATWRFFNNGAFLSQYVGGTANFGSTNNALQVALGYNAVANGTYDEARLLLETYSDDKVLTEYNAENDPSTFYSVGSELAA